MGRTPCCSQSHVDQACDCLDISQQPCYKKRTKQNEENITITDQHRFPQKNPQEMAMQRENKKKSQRIH